MKRHEAMSVPWEDISEAVLANPTRFTSLIGPVSLSISSLPSHEKVLSWLGTPGWTEDTTFVISDAVSLALWIRDPLFRTATTSVRRAMEKEEAAALIHASEAAWKERDGRQRGWVRKHLEEDLRARSAGANPSPDAWETIRTVKRAAQLLDYICVMRSMRLALWWPDHKAFTVIGAGSTLLQVNCSSSRLMLSPEGDYKMAAASWPALASRASASEMAWIVPANAPSMGSLTVAQIHEQLAALNPGLPRFTGNRQNLWTLLQQQTIYRGMKNIESHVT
jgi:hypothetical protein